MILQCHQHHAKDSVEVQLNFTYYFCSLDVAFQYIWHGRINVKSTYDMHSSLTQHNHIQALCFYWIGASEAPRMVDFAHFCGPIITIYL